MMRGGGGGVKTQIHRSYLLHGKSVFIFYQRGFTRIYALGSVTMCATVASLVRGSRIGKYIRKI